MLPSVPYQGQTISDVTSTFTCSLDPCWELSIPVNAFWVLEKCSKTWWAPFLLPSFCSCTDSTCLKSVKSTAIIASFPGTLLPHTLLPHTFAFSCLPCLGTRLTAINHCKAGDWGLENEASYTMCTFTMFVKDTPSRSLYKVPGSWYSTSIHSYTELLLHRYGSGVGPIHLSSVSCVGFERSLFDCPLTLGDGEGTCSHGMDVGIECSKLLRREGSKVKLWLYWERLWRQIRGAQYQRTHHCFCSAASFPGLPCFMLWAVFTVIHRNR